MIFHGGMIRVAREAAGWTQKKLALTSGVPQSRISKIEANLYAANDDTIACIADCLGVLPSFFTRQDPIIGLPTNAYRKRKTTPALQLRRLEGEINIVILDIKTLFSSLDASQPRLVQIEMSEEDNELTPAQCAAETRKNLSIPFGPIHSMTSVLESNGVIVVETPGVHRKFGGMSIQNGPTGNPLVFVRSEDPQGLKNFTLAHELGHLIMHNLPNNMMEPQADEFASEFLLPKAEIQSDLTRQRITWHYLFELKKKWRVQASALLMRATSLRLVSPRKAKSLWIEYGKAGCRAQEPAAIKNDPPRFMKAAFDAYKNKLDYSNKDLAKLLKVKETTLMQRWGPLIQEPKKAGLRLVL